MKIKAALNICARCIAGMALACLIFVPKLLFAQTDSAKKLKEVKIKETPVPQVQTITPEQQVNTADLNRVNAINVADAVRDFSGVNIKDYGGIGGLKTVSVRGLGADHLVVLYDGVAINDAENGQIDLGKYNLNGIEQIILYNAQPDNILSPSRSFASASVIAIKPVQPHLTVLKPFKVVAGVNGGSFGFINPYLQWQQRLSDRWSYVVNGYLESATGRYKFKNPEDGSDTLQTRTNADIHDQRIDGSLYWFKNDSNKFSLHINYYNSDRGLPAAVINYNPYSGQRLWNQDFFAQAGYMHTWNDGLQLLLNTKLSREYTRYIDPAYQNNNGGIDDRYTQREFYQSAALAYHITSTWQVSYAGDIALSTVGAESPTNSISNYAFPSRFTLQEVLASKLILNRWRFEGDLLHSYVNEWVQYGKATPDQNVLSPTLMTTFQPFAQPDLQLRAFYKDIFREPTLDEQYLFAPLGSRNVQPEFARQFDLGIAYRKAFDSFLGYLTLTIDGYYNRVTNKIVDLPQQNPDIPSVINIGAADIKGVDVGIKTQTRQSSGWRGLLSVNYTYQYAIDTALKLQIPYIPRNSVAFNAGVEYRDLGLYYNQIISSSRLYLEDINSQVSGYAVGDLALVYKCIISKKAMTFSAHINNLFNQQYSIVRSFPMPGRSYLLSFQITI
ncbi:MAG: TonB-dependent receptor plug domain-containing protein [Bacteroidetes bacterium]|nr:TonB-dependent receptor plug domain-containing protein [Bacteroidota bacterium]